MMIIDIRRDILYSRADHHYSNPGQRSHEERFNYKVFSDFEQLVTWHYCVVDPEAPETTASATMSESAGCTGPCSHHPKQGSTSIGRRSSYYNYGGNNNWNTKPTRL